MDYTHRAAYAQSQLAVGCLATLPDNEHRDALHTLAEFCVDRLR
jgi:geranylgeranyl pyrophosphate synthase